MARRGRGGFEVADSGSGRFVDDDRPFRLYRCQHGTDGLRVPITVRQFGSSQRHRRVCGRSDRVGQRLERAFDVLVGRSEGQDLASSRRQPAG